jgi:hypothetical protein
MALYIAMRDFDEIENEHDQKQLAGGECGGCQGGGKRRKTGRKHGRKSVSAGAPTRKGKKTHYKKKGGNLSKKLSSMGSSVGSSVSGFFRRTGSRIASLFKSTPKTHGKSKSKK